MSICCNFCTYVFLSRPKCVQFEDTSSRSESSFLNNNGFVVEILLFTIIPYNVDILNLDSLLNYCGT